jgi:FAD:protein FMN transferase
MGTFVALEAHAHSEQVAERALAQAWEAVTGVERVMHPDRHGSDLALLASCPGEAAIRVHPWTWEVLSLCRDLHAATGGAFDPCLEEQPGRLGDVVLTPPCLVQPLSRVRIDLGGIAKGFAVDRALQAMREAGCSAGLVNAGGDLAVFGALTRTVHCGVAARGATFELSNGAIASTDTAAADRPPQHRGYYHGSARRARVCGQAVVMAPHAVWADALTKCALLLSSSELEALLARAGARVLFCARVPCAA